ncbi:hypothetical protein SB658_23515, partial [Bacillus sp. SIMBA_008]|uniref:hypothetical protein n=1 Tax=Bacillus sp. SIMBA_008 TaxID=3085757 RepID=UPI0039795F4C
MPTCTWLRSNVSDPPSISIVVGPRNQSASFGSVDCREPESSNVALAPDRTEIDVAPANEVLKLVTVLSP